MNNKRSRYSTNPPSSPIARLLSDQGTGSLILQAQQSGQIEQTVMQWPPLRGISVQVGPLRTGKLKLFLGSPAALTRMKQLLPSLEQHLQAHGWHVTQIQLQIQTRQNRHTSLNKPPKRARFSEAAKKAWLDLEAELDDPNLLEATRALYKHHKLK